MGYLRETKCSIPVRAAIISFARSVDSPRMVRASPRGGAIAMRGEWFTMIGGSLTMLGEGLTLHGECFAMCGGSFTMHGGTLTIHGGTLTMHGGRLTSLGGTFTMSRAARLIWRVGVIARDSAGESVGFVGRGPRARSGDGVRSVADQG